MNTTIRLLKRLHEPLTCATGWYYMIYSNSRTGETTQTHTEMHTCVYICHISFRTREQGAHGGNLCHRASKPTMPDAARQANCLESLPCSVLIGCVRGWGVWGGDDRRVCYAPGYKSAKSAHQRLLAFVYVRHACVHTARTHVLCTYPYFSQML